MYTTIDYLKKCSACVPGFTRMVTFFSLDKSMKEVPIPLWMVSMACGVDDVQWVGQNALIIDPEEFKKFYRKYLNPVLRHVYWSAYSHSEGNLWHKPKMHPIAKEAMADMLKLGDSFEAAEAFLEKYKNYRTNHFIWERVLDNTVLLLGAPFINYILDNFGATVRPEVVQVLECGAYPQYGRYPTKTRQRSVSVRDDDDDTDEDDDNDDEDEQPRRLRDRLDAVKVPAKADVYYFGSDWTNRKNTQANVDIARVLTGSEDPHALALEWMAKHKVMEKNRVKGFMLSQASAGEPPAYHMTFNTADPRNIFDLFRMVTAKNSTFQDVLQATDLTANQVQDQLRSARVDSGSSIEIDQVRVDSMGRVTRTSAGDELGAEKREDSECAEEEREDW